MSFVQCHFVGVKQPGQYFLRSGVREEFHQGYPFCFFVEILLIGEESKVNSKDALPLPSMEEAGKVMR